MMMHGHALGCRAMLMILLLANDIHLISGTCTVSGITQSGGVLFEDLPDSKVLQFKTAGSVTFAQPVSVDVLVIGGGGSGTTHIGAGGGAGAVVFYRGAILAANTAYSVTVGQGGIRSTSSETPGVNGGASSIGSLFTAVGGGGGGVWAANLARSGGSGGGGGACNACSGTGGGVVATNVINGVSSLGPSNSQKVYGNSGGGGLSLSGGLPDPNVLVGGGGGGSGGMGLDSVQVPSAKCGGGGVGLNSTYIDEVRSRVLFGAVFGQAYTSVAQSSYIAAGGGGGGYGIDSSRAAICVGGVGGGGQGGKATSGVCASFPATNGLANTGSGGGGAGDSCQGGNGGSGLVLIRVMCEGMCQTGFTDQIMVTDPAVTGVSACGKTMTTTYGQLMLTSCSVMLAPSQTSDIKIGPAALNMASGAFTINVFPCSSPSVCLGTAAITWTESTVQDSINIIT